MSLNNPEELLLLIEENTNKLSEQSKPSPQETLEFKLHKYYETFPFNSPLD